jgi:CRP/FNR family cyclic AMP-dependent transcriptional regulator
MAAIRVLERLTGAQWRLLEGYGQIVPLAEGQVIIAEGQLEEAFYIVLSGVLQVVTRGPAGETLLGRFPAGSLFGEVSFFDGAPRTATVRAEVPANVLRVTREAFEQLRMSDADLATELALELGRTVASHFRERLARYNETTREP